MQRPPALPSRRFATLRPGVLSIALVLTGGGCAAVEHDPVGLADAHPHRLFVRFAPSATQPEVAAVLDGTSTPGRTPTAQFQYVHLEPTLYLVEYDGSVEGVVATLGAMPTVVQYVERDPRIRIASAGAQEVDLPLDWTLRADPPGALGDVPAVQAAFAGEPRHRDAAVAVLDTGYAAAHPALQGAVDVQADHVEGGDADARDLHPHGTAVAAIVAGNVVPDRGRGVAPFSALQVHRVMDEGEGWLGDALEALDAVVGAGVRVSCNAWYTGVQSQAFADALQGSGAAGHLFVTAATNFGAELRDVDVWPAAFAPLPGLLVVGAVDATGARASFSNFSKTPTAADPAVAEGLKVGAVPGVALGAPGVDVRVALPPSGWTVDSGTSYGAAHVAGAVALALSVRSADRRPNDAESLPVERIVQALAKTVRPVAAVVDDFVLDGDLDALAFVEALRALP